MEIDWNKLFAETTFGTIDTGYKGIEPGTVCSRFNRYVGTNACGEIMLPIELPHMENLRAWSNLFSNAYNERIEGGITMFNLNDELKIVKSEYKELLDRVGTVRDIVKREDGTVVFGLEIKDLKVGHDMSGKCPSGDGWYVLESELELLHKSMLCRMVVKNEDLLKAVRENAIDKYQVRKNGALTFLTQEGRKVFVYKDGATSPLTLNCISENDKIVTLHLMECFRILPMHTIDGDKLFLYTQEQSDKLEADLFPVETPVVVDPVVKSFEAMVSPETPVAKVYSSEEELYAEMGITKK